MLTGDRFIKPGYSGRCPEIWQPYHVARMEEGRSAFKILTGTSVGIPLGRPSRRWEDNIRMDLKEIRYQYEELG